MKETKITHNSLYADPDRQFAADRVNASMAVVFTAGIAQAARWKYVVWLSIAS